MLNASGGVVQIDGSHLLDTHTAFYRIVRIQLDVQRMAVCDGGDGTHDRQARNHIIEVADAYDQRWSAPLGFVANRGAKVDFYEVALFE